MHCPKDEIINNAVRDILDMPAAELSDKKKLLRIILDTIWISGKCEGIKEMTKEMRE